MRVKFPRTVLFAGLVALSIIELVSIRPAFAVSPSTESAAYADAGRIFFQAIGYNAAPIAVTSRPSDVAAVCDELKRVQEDCVAVDGAIQGYSSGTMIFVLARQQKTWNFLSAEKEGKLGQVALPGYEILCASYLVQELSRIGVPQAKVRDLLNPRKHAVLAQVAIRWPAVSIITTDAASIITMKDRENIRCFLVQPEQPNALVAASVTLRN